MFHMRVIAKLLSSFEMMVLHPFTSHGIQQCNVMCDVDAKDVSIFRIHMMLSAPHRMLPFLVSIEVLVVAVNELVNQVRAVSRWV